MKDNKKGFTLVELLAVIAILAIILLIAVPAILGVIDEARKNAFKSATLAAFHSAELYKVTNDGEALSGCVKAGTENNYFNLSNFADNFEELYVNFAADGTIANVTAKSKINTNWVLSGTTTEINSNTEFNMTPKCPATTPTPEAGA